MCRSFCLSTVIFTKQVNSKIEIILEINVLQKNDIGDALVFCTFPKATTINKFSINYGNIVSIYMG